jgi:hypothetical protein
MAKDLNNVERHAGKIKTEIKTEPTNLDKIRKEEKARTNEAGTETGQVRTTETNQPNQSGREIGRINGKKTVWICSRPDQNQEPQRCHYDGNHSILVLLL